MAAFPTPDPSAAQPSAAPAPQAGAQPGPGDASAAPTQAPASPDLMALAKVSMVLKQLSQQNPAASAGLAKAMQGINEAMSAIVSQPQQDGQAQSPPY